MTILKNDDLIGQYSERDLIEDIAKLAAHGKLNTRNASTVVVNFGELLHLDDPVALVIDLALMKITIESFDMATFQKTNEYVLLINENAAADILDKVDCFLEYQIKMAKAS